VALVERRLKENVSGEFYVDDTCIDCNACRQIAPTVFGVSARQLSFVRHQPGSPWERHRALMALVACPTASIGTLSRIDARPAVAAFPEPIAEGVEYCGFASRHSYGGSSYLIRRSEGNVLVDSPRGAGPLLEEIASRGGVRFMFLSHRDDVADHERFRRRFLCERILHVDDLTRETQDVEWKITGSEPTPIAGDLLVIPVPGHTRGSMALLYRNEFLFTGDHLFASEGGEGLTASREVCWYSWDEQVRSLERLLDYEFQWVLPGHGFPFRRERHAMRRELEKLVVRLKG
jgi:glyoxylase-like metal-dependent hydrolase (beta-lactamase superfamily II)/ferredoxin